jgi:hypothetical protein
LYEAEKNQLRSSEGIVPEIPVETLFELLLLALESCDDI